MTPGLRQAAGLVLAACVLGLGGNAFRDPSVPLAGPLEPPAPAEVGADLPATPPSEARDAWLEGAFFLDVRDRDAWEASRVAGAWSLAAADFDERYFEVGTALDLSLPVVLYGAGPDSFEVRRTAGRLTELGHADVRFVTCGLPGLLAAGIDEAQGPAEDAP